MTFQGSPRIKTMTLSVLFNTIVSVFALKCLLLQKNQYIMVYMENFISFQKNDYSAGKTDLRELIGRTYIPNECVLLLCTEGRAIITMNSRKQAIRKGDLVILFSDVLLSPVHLSPAFCVNYLHFSHSLMEKIYYDLTSETFWKLIYDNPVFRLSEEQYDLLQGWFKQMEWIMLNCDEANKTSTLRSNIYNLFILLDSEMRRNFPSILQNKEKDRGRMLFGKFMTLLVKNCHEVREVAYYADRLCITKDYLYKICNKVEHRTPKEIIDNIVANEIKQYLSDTELSIKDIARTFNFEDSSYLARFFRRMTGMSPLDYRGR